MVVAVGSPVATAGVLVVNGKLDTTTNHLAPPTWYFPQHEHTDSARPMRLTQARIGDTFHDGNGTRVAIVNAFTTVNPETGATVRAVDYQVIGGAPTSSACIRTRRATSPAGGVSRHRLRRPREGLRGLLRRPAGGAESVDVTS